MKNTTTDEPQRATAHQFQMLLLRMLPTHLQDMPETKLIGVIFHQAWLDVDLSSARNFFINPESPMSAYCEAFGWDAGQIRRIFKEHNGGYRDYLDSMTEYAYGG